MSLRHKGRAYGACGITLALVLAAPPLWAQPDDAEEETAAEKPAEEPTEDDSEPADEPKPEPPPEPKPEAEPEPEKAPEPPPQDAVAADSVEGDGGADADWRKKLRLELGPVHIAPIVLVATQLTPYVGDEAYFQSGDIAERPGFRLRYARLGFDAGYTDQARLRVSTELGTLDEGGSARIQDAWAAYTPFDFFGIYAGAHTMPFSRNRLIRTGRGALIERPLMVRAMAPGSQVGGSFQGDVGDGAFGYGVGVYNGLQRSNRFYEGYTENYAPFGNRFDGVAVAGRLSTEPLGHLSPSAADEGQGKFRFGVGGNYLFSDGGARDIHSAGGDLHIQVAGFHLLAEGLWGLSLPEEEPTEPTTAIEKVTSFGVSAEAGYVILPRMLGLAARFEFIDPDIDSDDESDNWLVTGGAFFMFVDELFKLQAEYTHREERFGLSLANDAVTLSLQAQLDPARIERKENQ